MSQESIILIVGAAANGLVTWGVISQKLAWLRADVDDLKWRVDRLAGVRP